MEHSADTLQLSPTQLWTIITLDGASWTLTSEQIKQSKFLYSATQFNQASTSTDAFTIHIPWAEPLEHALNWLLDTSTPVDETRFAEFDKLGIELLEPHRILNTRNLPFCGDVIEPCHRNKNLKAIVSKNSSTFTRDRINSPYSTLEQISYIEIEIPAEVNKYHVLDYVICDAEKIPSFAIRMINITLLKPTHLDLLETADCATGVSVYRLFVTCRKLIIQFKKIITKCTIYYELGDNDLQCTMHTASATVTTVPVITAAANASSNVEIDNAEDNSAHTSGVISGGANRPYICMNPPLTSISISPVTYVVWCTYKGELIQASDITIGGITFTHMDFCYYMIAQNLHHREPIYIKYAHDGLLNGISVTHTVPHAKMHALKLNQIRDWYYSRKMLHCY